MASAFFVLLCLSLVLFLLPLIRLKDLRRTIEALTERIAALERKLNNAGIYTFDALAALSKTDLENILGSQVKRLQDENNLIAQAKRLAEER